jgi:hypothetical protein
MGYQIEYIFHPEASKGEYDRTTTQNSSVTVGSPYEEVSLEVLAGKVMALMARRNILVISVEIFEMVKKQLTFKEVEDGIIIKNKKFKFDDGPAVQTGEEIKESPQQQLQALLAANPGLAGLMNPTPVPSPAQISTQLAIKTPTVAINTPPAIPAGVSPIRYEFYRPDDPFWENYAKQSIKEYAFTMGKRYPILSEKTRPLASVQGAAASGLFYETIDDKNRRQVLPNQLFVPQMPKLEHSDAPSSGLTDSGLYWGGTQDESVPDLRKRR